MYDKFGGWNLNSGSRDLEKWMSCHDKVPKRLPLFSIVYGTSGTSLMSIFAVDLGDVECLLSTRYLSPRVEMPIECLYNVTRPTS